MLKQVRQAVVLGAALTVMAAPILSCCLGMVSQAHGAMVANAPPGYTSGGSMNDHCANAGTDHAPAPSSDHDDGCGGCGTCKAVQIATQESVTGTPGLLVQIDFAPFVASVRSWPDFAPELLRATGPSHDPPILHRTPVRLNTMLRL